MLFGPIESPKSDQYVSRLVSAYKGLSRIPDIDHATARNLDAWEMMNLDPSFRHSIDYTRQLISGYRYKLKSASSDKSDRLKKNIIEEMLANIKDFTKARFSLSEVLFRGESYAYIRGHRKYIKLGKFPAQQWWVPYKIQHIDKWRVRKTYTEDKHIQYWLYSIESEKWKAIDSRALIALTNTDEEMYYTHGNGLLNSLWHAFFSKKVAEEFALQYLERFASGLIDIGVDHERDTSEDRTAKTIAAEYLTMIEDIKANGAFSHDKRDELKMLEPGGSGWEVIKFMLNYYDNVARLLSIGANLPVSADNGGSFALGAVQENSVLFKARYGRMLIENAMTDDLIGLINQLNYRQFAQIKLHDAKPPTFLLPEERNIAPAQELSNAQAIHALGGSVIKREIYEKANFTEAVEGEDDVFESPQAMQAEQTAQGGGLGALLGAGSPPPSSASPQASGEGEPTPFEVIKKSGQLTQKPKVSDTEAANA